MTRFHSSASPRCNSTSAADSEIKRVSWIFESGAIHDQDVGIVAISDDDSWGFGPNPHTARIQSETDIIGILADFQRRRSVNIIEPAQDQPVSSVERKICIQHAAVVGLCGLVKDEADFDVAAGGLKRPVAAAIGGAGEVG